MKIDDKVVEAKDQRRSSGRRTLSEALNLAGWVWAFVGPLVFGVLMAATERLSHMGWGGIEQFELFYCGQLFSLLVVLLGSLLAVSRSVHLLSCFPSRRGVWVFLGWVVAHGLILVTHPAQWGLFKSMVGRLCQV